MREHIKKEFTLYKYISVIIIISIFILILFQKDSFYAKAIYIDGQETEEVPENLKRDYYEIAQDTVLKQDFVAQEKRIESIKILFRNEHTVDAQGHITIGLSDKSGNILFKDNISMSDIPHRKWLTVAFVNSGIDENAPAVTHHRNTISTNGIDLIYHDTYRIFIQCTDISPDDHIGLCLTFGHSDKEEDILDNENAVEGRSLYGFINYQGYEFQHFSACLCIIIFSLFLVLLPWKYCFEHIASYKNTDIELHAQRILFILTPVCCYLMSYIISGFTAVKIRHCIFSFFGLVNLLLVILWMLLLYALTNSKKAASALCLLTTFILLVSCYFLILFRDIPLRATDFADIGTAMDVASRYEIVLTSPVLYIIVISGCLFSLNLIFSDKKKMILRTRIIFLITVCILFTGLYNLITNNRIASKYDIRINAFNPTLTYKKMGYTLGFLVSFQDIHIEKPEGYTLDKVQELTQHYASDKKSAAAEISEKKPNIIVIMNEAYSDLSVLGNISVNKDYMPFFNSLNENTKKGVMHTSVFGGGTANTEFEFLTGNTIAFLKRKTAYTSLIKNDFPSVARTLKDQGYGGMIAFHPGMADSYNRNKVYPFLGFDKYISLENLENPDMIRGFVSDKGVYETVIHEYEDFKDNQNNDQPFFMFNVTIQNHSAFNYSTGIVDAGIEIKDPELDMEQTGQYLNLIKESDEAFKYLVNYFKEQKEPTVIVMFGDHQPRVEDEFYEKMMERMNPDIPEIDKSERRYRVPFIIWANYDIREEENIDISSNMLGSYMLNTLGLKMTGYDKYLMDLYTKIPVVTSVCYMDYGKQIYKMNTFDLKNIKMGEDLLNYQYIEYNNMKNSSKRIPDFFTLIE